MQHTEQPSLPGIVDHGVGREWSRAPHADVARRTDVAVYVVRNILVIDEVFDRLCGRKRPKPIELVFARAEEEDTREIVLRLPRSEKLKSVLIEETRNYQNEPELDARNTH